RRSAKVSGLPRVSIRPRRAPGNGPATAHAPGPGDANPGPVHDLPIDGVDRVVVGSRTRNPEVRNLTREDEPVGTGFIASVGEPCSHGVSIDEVIRPSRFLEEEPPNHRVV